MSRKVFTAGEVLAAADVNSFLMDQTVMSFAGTAARGSAIGTAVEGMVTYLEDIDDLRIYNGSSWVSPYGMTLLADTTFTSQNSVSFNNVFSAAYRNYKVIYDLTGGGGRSNIRLRAAGSDDTGSNYVSSRISAFSTNLSSAGSVSAQTSFIDVAERGDSGQGFGEITIYSPFVNTNTAINFTSLFRYAAEGQYIRIGTGQNTVTTSFDGFTFFAQFPPITGNIKVYGLRG